MEKKFQKVMVKEDIPNLLRKNLKERKKGENDQKVMSRNNKSVWARNEKGTQNRGDI